MPAYDIVIKNGLIFDGARVPRYRGDIAIRDGVIVEIGRIDEADAARVIDAEGLHVAPGFIDLHTHYDAQVLWDPLLSPSSQLGVTAVVAGNCGFSLAPCAADQRESIIATFCNV